MAGSNWRRALERLVGVVVQEGGRSLRRGNRRVRRPGAQSPPLPEWATPGSAPPARAPLPPAAPPRRIHLATDYTGPLELDYAPRADDRPDPGEVVWTWVPFDEGDGRGKDRPVLVVGRDGDALLGLMMTSKDHDRDAADEARHGRHWVDVGTGGWDRQGRPSEVRIDRVLRIDPSDVRREGAALGRRQFDQVAVEVRRLRG
ncbi:type II toxin-antitoxin system PemK/MazF family toxin [Modestobacter marinus]|uniref:PemK-like protein n=1 Tax=Modestobacter marinus TaxID=477641 RepID=A0A846LJL2_9ACTN|nr:type II toxin-antitoxin system PemK/MazF family toxin [Modestobacter marinus]NIH66192.1 hypothetical protein [Modestobacter marinus]